MFLIKRTISTFAAHVLVKNYMKLKRMNLMKPLTRKIMNFSLKLIIIRTLRILDKSRMRTLTGHSTLEWDSCFIFIETNNNQNSAHIRQIKNENSDWSLYPWMGFLFHRKLIPEINVTLFLWQFWKSLILNPNYFQWTYSYPHIINLKFSYLECSLTLKHKNNHFDVLFIVVDSKSIPILGLSNSESLNLIKHISAVNASDEQFLSEFFFIVLDNLTPVITPVRKISLALKPE